MSDRILVATRKGLFILERRPNGWTTTATAFPGVPVTAVVADARDGAVYAALKHGHFGPKLHRSEDAGRTWQDIATPAFPADAAGQPSLTQMWTLETGGPHHPGRLWMGALPAGLFRSDDRGESWELMRALWDVPERTKWFGGGYDEAGIHSVSPDPRVPGRTAIAISCGGVWDTSDDGTSWTVRGKGLIAAYMPPEQAETPEVQDPHRVVRSPADPDVMWMQHDCGIFHSADAGAHWG